MDAGRLLLLTLLPTLLLLAGPGFAAEEDWQLQRQEDGITVHTRQVPGYSYKEVRSRVVMQDTRLTSIVALILDTEKCSTWAYRCSQAQILEWIDAQENYFQMVTDLPWPARDRDMVTHARWWQEPDTLQVTLQGIGTPEKLPEQEGLVRINRSVITWTLAPQEPGNVELTLTAHVDPSGLLPNWITNMMLVETPFRSMQAIRSLVNTPEFREATLPYVREP